MPDINVSILSGIFKKMKDMGDANLLHDEIGKAYATRWADLVPPTLAECQAFINAIIHETSNQEAPSP